MKCGVDLVIVYFKNIKRKETKEYNNIWYWTDSNYTNDFDIVIFYHTEK